MNSYDTYFKNFPKEDYGIQDFSLAIVTPQNEYVYNYQEKELYDLASMTKLFTLNLIYNLERQKKISFHHPISMYLDVPRLKNYTILDVLKMNISY